jgi:hypothetical protein
LTTQSSSTPPPPLPLPPPSLSSTSDKENQSKLIEQANDLLNIVVQLGNHQEIEQLRNKIKVMTYNIKI